MSQAASRTQLSHRFEEAVRSASVNGQPPKRSDLDLRRIRDFAPWIAIIEPDLEARKLPFRLVGTGLFEILKRDFTGQDYLDLAKPEVRDSAYHSVLAMLAQPCGLWQRTPVNVEQASPYFAEYTGFPLHDERRDARQVVFLIQHSLSDELELPQAHAISSAQDWFWIDMGHGIPTPNPPRP